MTGRQEYIDEGNTDMQLAQRGLSFNSTYAAALPLLLIDWALQTSRGERSEGGGQ